MQVDSTDNVHLSRSDISEIELPHGFKFSEDRKSAYKTISKEIQGETKEVTFKVNFHENDAVKHLEKFDDTKVNYFIDQSIELGLGNKFTNVSMTRSALTGEKRNGTIRYLNKNFYDKKIKSTDDIAKKGFFERNKVITQELKYKVQDMVPESEDARQLRLESKNKKLPSSKTDAKKEYYKNKKKLKKHKTELHDVEKKLKKSKVALDKYFVGDIPFTKMLDEFMKTHPGCTEEELNSYSQKLMEDKNFHSS